MHGGAPYAGNIRIELGDDDKVAVHFAYYQDWSEWRQDSPVTHVVLDGSRGVGVEKMERLVYRQSYGGKSVVFALNDLSQVRPPAGALAPGEKFIGPIFDESAIRFFLVYNSKLKVFHYILDETMEVADEFFPRGRSNRILIGKRTGFAFYRDHRLERKILVGVYEGNYRLNTYFDGPFDQLPDNFIESELYGVDKCARARAGAASYYECFEAEPAERDFGATRQREEEREAVKAIVTLRELSRLVGAQNQRTGRFRGRPVARCMAINFGSLPAPPSTAAPTPMATAAAPSPMTVARAAPSP